MCYVDEPFVIYSTNGKHDAYDKMLAFAALHEVKLMSEKFLLTVEGIEESLRRDDDISWGVCSVILRSINPEDSVALKF
jgi:hypothetical protein